MQNITAVEWLIDSIESLEYNLENKIISIDDYIINLEWVKKQAKAMEKEQIINAIDSQYNYDSWPKELPTLGEQYYNETYKK